MNGIQEVVSSILTSSTRDTEGLRIFFVNPFLILHLFCIKFCVVSDSLIHSASVILRIIFTMRIFFCSADLHQHRKGGIVIGPDDRLYSQPLIGQRQCCKLRALHHGRQAIVQGRQGNGQSGCIGNNPLGQSVGSASAPRQGWRRSERTS